MNSKSGKGRQRSVFFIYSHSAHIPCMYILRTCHIEQMTIFHDPMAILIRHGKKKGGYFCDEINYFPSL